MAELEEMNPLEISIAYAIDKKYFFMNQLINSSRLINGLPLACYGHLSKQCHYEIIGSNYESVGVRFLHSLFLYLLKYLFIRTWTIRRYERRFDTFL